MVVTNCNLSSNCNLIKFGTSGIGGFKNIVVCNCVLHAASKSKFRNWNKIIESVTDSLTGISGIALEVVAGGIMDQVTISNITMNDVQTPLFIRLRNRRNATGVLKNILISNIVATAHSLIPSSINAVPGFYIENVIIRDVIVNCKGGGTLADANLMVPENEKAYPENRMFGNTLPAYGLSIRHARNIYLNNIQFYLQRPDARPALVFDDFQDVTLRAFKTLPATGQKLIKRTQSSIKILE